MSVTSASIFEGILEVAPDCCITSPGCSSSATPLRDIGASGHDGVWPHLIF